jgi:hypothetical protein
VYKSYLIAQYKNHNSSAIHSLSVSYDSTYFISSDENEIVLCDLEYSKNLNEFFFFNFFSFFYAAAYNCFFTYRSFKLVDATCVQERDTKNCRLDVVKSEKIIV